MSEVGETAEKAQTQVAAVEAVVGRWSNMITESQQADSRWILDRSVTTVMSLRDELQRALDLRCPPAQPTQPGTTP